MGICSENSDLYCCHYSCLSKKYLEKLTKIVEGKIRHILPHTFAILFDWWTTSDAHYIAMYATFADDCTLGYKSVLLAFSPFESEDSQSAETIISSYSSFSSYLESLLNMWSPL